MTNTATNEINGITLVQVEGETVFTTSRDVADVFGKRHDHVLRDIENLKREIPQGHAPKFGAISLPDFCGRLKKAYVMDRKAFTLLAMGFTGPKALEFKLRPNGGVEASMACRKLNDDKHGTNPIWTNRGPRLVPTMGLGGGP